MNVVCFDNINKDFKLIICWFAFQTIAKFGPASILNFINYGIDPKEQELIISQFFRPSKLGLKGWTIFAVENWLNFNAWFVDCFVAVITTFICR